MKPALLLPAALTALLGACTPPPASQGGVVPAGAPSTGTGALVDRMPVVTGTIDRQAVTLLLDTGASITCLQPAASQRIGRAVAGQTRLGGLGDTTHSVLTYGPATVVLGGFTAAVRSLHGCPTLPLVGRSGRVIDGVLGADALHGITVVVDYPENAVRVLPAWSPVASDSAVALPITFVRGLPVITIELWSRGRWEPVSLLLDTGADASLLFGAQTAAALELEPDPYQPPSERRGLGGAIATHPFHVSRARLGTLEVRDLSVEVAATSMGETFARGIQGIAGADFLRYFRLELDLGNARMSIDPPGPSRSVCGTKSGICVAPRPDRSGYVIQSVRPRSSAARYGIESGETVIRVGTADTQRMSPAELRAALAPGNGLLSLMVRNSFGRVRRVEFRIAQ
jgi:hypothetical protein